MLMNKSLILFRLNNQLFKAKRINLNLNLTKTRILLGLDLPENAIFILSDGTEIEKNEESKIRLDEICDKNTIYLIKKENNNKENLKLPIYTERLNKIQKTGNDYPGWLNYNEPIKMKNEKLKEVKNKKMKLIQKEKEEKNLVENNITTINIKIIKNEYKYLLPPVKYSLTEKYNKRYKSQIIKNKIIIKNENINENIKYNGRKYPSISSCRKIEKIGDLDIYLYPHFSFHFFEEMKAINFMVIGETGSGKTTLLNSFVNFILGVNLEDNYRFKIVIEKNNNIQSKSQTNDVRIYNIRSSGGYPPIRIIDTPGFGDTNGIEADQEITNKIEKFFKENIITINAICFVTKSSNNRLTVSQKYIIARILDIFGEDIKEIFIFMLTFCDGAAPNIIEQLQNKGCPFKEIIELLKDFQWYYKFNNSAFFEPKRDDKFTQIFWKLGIKNFQEFMFKLELLPRKCLSLTKEVLKERKILEDKIAILNRKLKEGLNKIEEIKGIIEIISNIQNDLNISKNYNKSIKIQTVKRIDKNPNFYATTCIICNKTCHPKCEISDDDEKHKCTSMDKNGNCTFCPKKCRWDQHKNRNYILEELIEEKEVTLEDLQKRYLSNIEKISVKKQLFNGAKEELIELYMQCLECQTLIYKSINHLQQIALNKSTFKSDEEFIDLLIEVEKSEHKPGWQNRINNLEILKEQKKILRQLYQGNNSQLDFIKEFTENELSKYYNFKE